MSQQIENKDPLLSSLSDNLNINNNTSRLPLRKRIGPALKWQPLETPDENYKQKNAYPSPQQQQYPILSSSEDVVSEGDTTETDEDKNSNQSIDNQKPISLKKHLQKEESQLSSNGNKRSEKEDIANRPTKKVKRGRPPLQKNTSTTTLTEIPSLPSTPSTPPPPQTTTTTRPPDDDSNTLYCICKRPYDVPRFMIACDRCNEWFHGECIEISEKQGEFIDLYFCENCSKITGKKTSWKPRCANPTCSKPARIGTHQGHLSKYCTDNCGMQVARVRIELAELKKKTALGQLDDQLDHTYNPLSRVKLSSFADLDDRARLSRVKEEKLHAKFMIGIGELKSSFLKILINNQREDICGFDSRLSWSDSLWEKIDRVVEQSDSPLLLDPKGEVVQTSKSHFVCSQSKKCTKHASWQKLKASELEQERSEQFVILTMLERERQQIKARMKKRREEVDLVDYLENGTITHY